MENIQGVIREQWENKDRDGFLDSRVAVFVVRLPLGLNPLEAKAFKKEVADSLDLIAQDALSEIESQRVRKELWGTVR